jgi:hypothetical protein
LQLDGGDGAAGSASQRQALRQEIARLRNASTHLESSNVELKAALAADPGDQDFKDAIGENIAVIAKYRARVAALQQELEAAGGGCGEVGGVETPEAADTADAEIATTRLRDAPGPSPAAMMGVPAGDDSGQQHAAGDGGSDAQPGSQAMDTT